MKHTIPAGAKAAVDATRVERIAAVFMVCSTRNIVLMHVMKERICPFVLTFGSEILVHVGVTQLGTEREDDGSRS